MLIYGFDELVLRKKQTTIFWTVSRSWWPHWTLNRIWEYGYHCCFDYCDRKFFWQPFGVCRSTGTPGGNQTSINYQLVGLVAEKFKLRTISRTQFSFSSFIESPLYSFSIYTWMLHPIARHATRKTRTRRPFMLFRVHTTALRIVYEYSSISW